WRYVVEPVGERNSVVVSAYFAVLFEGSMEIPDFDVRSNNHLAVELRRDPDDPVHRRMRRPDADVQVLRPAAGAAPLAEHELAPRRRRHGRAYLARRPDQRLRSEEHTSELQS